MKAKKYNNITFTIKVIDEKQQSQVFDLAWGGALGFVEVDTEQISDGIRYIPMTYSQKDIITAN